MEFAIGSTAREARSTSSSVNWKPLLASTWGLLQPHIIFCFDHQHGQNQYQIADLSYL
jgi:hypothetical protein